MFDSFTNTYKKKNQIIIVASIIFVIICYFFAFGKTFKLIKENSVLTGEIQSLESAPSKIAIYKQDLEVMNASLGYVGSKDKMSQEYILDFVSYYTDTSSVFLKSMPKTLIEDKNGYQLETNILELEGDFKGIVHLIYQIEFKHKISKVVSTKFKLNEDVYTKKKSLIATVYLQNIII